MYTLVFDLDGTLANSRESILASVRYALTQTGMSNCRFDEIFVTQHDLATSFKKIVNESGGEFRQELCDQFISAYRKHQVEEAEEILELFPKVGESLTSLRTDFRMAVATTKHSEQAERVLKRLRIHRFFDWIQGTDPGLRYKPHPDILWRSLDGLGAKPAQAAYIGDSVHDMQAARSAGMREIGAGYGFAGPELLKGHKPHYLLNCISELVELGPELSSGFS